MSDQKNAANFHAGQDPVFARIAEKYDFLCDIFSFCLHRLWKKAFINNLPIKHNIVVIDLASGTGDIPFRILKKHQLVQELIVSDLCPAMIQQAQKKLMPFKTNMRFEVLNAENLYQLPPNSADLVTMSLGIKICDRQLVFSEVYRILKPGGGFYFLEAAHLPWQWLHKLYLRYMKWCIPVIGRLAASGDKSVYQYLLKGIEKMPPQHVIAKEMQNIGFESTRWKNLSFGIVAIHSGYKSH